MTSGNDAGNPPGYRPPAYYAEDHCALNWRFVSAGLLAPVVVIAAIVAAVALDNAASWVLLGVMLLGTMTWVAFGQMLPYAWPLGIRLDSDGLRIGGMRWAEKHPGRARRKATVPRQYGQVFACRWDGVQRIGVTRDRKAIRTSVRRASHGIRRTPLGNLAVPFMRAAVVILVDREQCTLPRIGPAKGLLSVNWSSPGFHQPLWVVPTRHPAELEAALAALPLPSGAVGDPFPGTAGQPSIIDWFASCNSPAPPSAQSGQLPECRAGVSNGCGLLCRRGPSSRRATVSPAPEGKTGRAGLAAPGVRSGARGRGLQAGRWPIRG